jgi:hypothetical protein
MALSLPVAFLPHKEHLDLELLVQRWAIVGSLELRRQQWLLVHHNR